MSAQDPQQQGKPIIDVLIDRQRVIGATRMFIDGKDAASITEEEARLVIQQVELYAKSKKPPVSRKDIARAIGVSPPTMSEVLSMSYRGDWRSVILHLDRWLDQQAKADAAPQVSQFCWTSVAREIETVARLVQQLRKIGLVYGPDTAGIGKTLAMEALNRVLPGSVLITVEKAHASPTGLLRAIAGGLRINSGKSNPWLFDKIAEKLSGTPRLLMIDQVHNLRNAKNDKALFYLTDLWDRTKSPQLWCGTADLVAYLQREKARGNETLAQIRSRITYVRDLMQRTREPEHGGRGEPLVTLDQMIEMFGKNKIRITTDGIRMLWSVACLPDDGALRTCTNLVLIATIVAEQQGIKQIDARLLKAALRDSVQSETFNRIVADSNEFLDRLVKVA
jgi:DNA transposition AAA+ family ATPase